MTEMVSETTDAQPILILVTDIVAAYVSNNSLPSNEVPALIQSVHSAMLNVATATMSAVAPEKLQPAVPIKKSMTDDFIICLEDGLKFKSMKRHLMTKFQMTPEQYREKWGLPDNYPMVAPKYSTARSAMARAAGLGSKKQGKRQKKGAH